MTSRPVTFAQIECDTCGTRRDNTTNRDAITARISASHDGWKFVTWDIRGKGYQKYDRSPLGVTKSPGVASRETVPRQWDCCPDCPLPESPVEAARIRDSRKTLNHSGKWVDREAAAS